MGYLANWTARLFRRLADKRLKPLGLSSAHLPVVNALKVGVPLSQKALAEMVAIEQPTMAATLARMERDGIVERRPNPDDGRSSLFSLTPESCRKVKTLEETVERMNADSLEAVPADKREEFRLHFQSVIDSLTRAIDEEE